MIAAAVGSTEFHERAIDLFGFIPTYFDELKNSPAVANAYLSALEALKDGVLTKSERNIIMLAVSAANDATYCMEVHRAMAQEGDAEAQDLNLIAMQQQPIDMRLQALTQTTWRLIDKDGRLDVNDLKYLGNFGIEHKQIYEVIATIGVKTIMNYIQHVRNIGGGGGNGTTR